MPSFEQVTYCRLTGEPVPHDRRLDRRVDARTRERRRRLVERALRAARPRATGLDQDGARPIGSDVDADARSFDPDPERLERLAGWASRRFLPLEEARPPETCLYTNTPDGEFVLDRLGPIVVGSPCSGHGFKFAPLIAKILADMATGSPRRAARRVPRGPRVDATTHGGSRLRRLTLRGGGRPPTRSRRVLRAAPRSAARRASGAFVSPSPARHGGTPPRPCDRAR